MYNKAISYQNITLKINDKTYTLTTDKNGKITTTHTITKSDNIINVTATLSDNTINTGKIVFKINSKTVKDANGKVI